MKISALTITLIVLIIMSLVGYYMSAIEYNKVNAICDMFKDKMMNNENSIEFSEAMMETWQTCLSGKVGAFLDKKLTGIVGMIFIFLAILSWKVDRLKNE